MQLIWGNVSPFKSKLLIPHSSATLCTWFWSSWHSLHELGGAKKTQPSKYPGSLLWWLGAAEWGKAAGSFYCTIPLIVTSSSLSKMLWHERLLRIKEKMSKVKRWFYRDRKAEISRFFFGGGGRIQFWQIGMEMTVENKVKMSSRYLRKKNQVQSFSTYEVIKKIEMLTPTSQTV